MKLSETIEEILEMLWVSQEEKGAAGTDLQRMAFDDRDSAIAELVKLGAIVVEDGKARLLEEGKKLAKNMVRRHRLAERLMADVLQLEAVLVNQVACQFEHILQPEVEESVCILLGHPKVCPHGKEIPRGRCCLESRWTVESAVRPLTSLEAGQKGKIAYIHTGNDRRLEKLMAMGVLPGMRISLLHKFPSYVFKIGHSQAAVDKEMAGDIYVKLEKTPGLTQERCFRE